jgi:hypothetical protein
MASSMVANGIGHYFTTLTYTVNGEKKLQAARIASRYLLKRGDSFGWLVPSLADFC